MGLKWIISILWAFKGAPPASRTKTGTFQEKKFLLLPLRFLSDGNDGLKYKNKS